MTPLLRILLRFVPRPLALIALALAYAVMMIGLMATRGSGKSDIIYVDVKGR
jgi:hypothetical protein